MIRLRSLAWLVCLVSAGAMAQDKAYPVWRCGHEFTNQPRPGENCQVVELPSEITMTAPRKPRSVAPSDPAPAILVAPRLDLNAQRQRNDHAKSLLNDELLKTQNRCQQLAASSTDLVRCRADEAALRRELARLP